MDGQFRENGVDIDGGVIKSDHPRELLLVQGDVEMGWDH